MDDGVAGEIINVGRLGHVPIARRGLPLMTDADHAPLRFDVLRPQRLARPLTVYVEQFSAHPLAADSAVLYGPPDGYIDRDGEVLRERGSPEVECPLGGFVLEGSAPYGSAAASIDEALRIAAFSGMPTVRVGRGNAEGFVAHERVSLGIAGANLTATKARLLLRACLMRFGALPPARNPRRPTAIEAEATETSLKSFQAVFDSH